MTIKLTDIPHVIRAMGQQEFWDMSVYKATDQLLAAINGCKGIGKDYRMLKPQSPDDDPLDYVVQHVEPGWMNLPFPEDYASRAHEYVDSTVLGAGAAHTASTSGASQARAANQPATSANFVHDLVACLSKATSDDRGIWIAIGLALKTEGGGKDTYFPDFLSFSEKSSKFPGEEECRKRWAGFNTRSRGSAGSCGVGTIIFHAKADNPAACKAARRKEMDRMRKRMGQDTAGGSGGGGEGGGDRHGPLRNRLIELHPDFKDITKEAFTLSCVKDGMIVRLKDPTLPGDTFLHVTGSVEIAGVNKGELAPGLQIENVHRVSHGPKVTKYRLACSNDGEDMTLVDLADQSSLKICGINSAAPLGSYLIAGDRAQNLTSQQIKQIVLRVREQVFAHVDASLGADSGTASQYFNITFNQTINNNNITLHAAASLAVQGEEKLSDFKICRKQLDDAGLQGRLKKLDDNIYQPDLEAAFVERMSEPAKLAIFKIDHAVMAASGFRMEKDARGSFKREMVCKACKGCVVTEEETGCGEASDVDSDDAAEEDTDTDTDTDPTSSPSSEAEEPNPAVFAAHGFSVTGKRINVCLRCKKKALLGCCPLSRDMKRGKKFLVLNMEMLPDVEEDMDDWNFGRYKVAR
ncbi:MAG: hypothetical protein WDW38_006686 [Sanguina aurantia]